MITSHINDIGYEISVTWDDLMIQKVDSVDHSVFYTCTGYDDFGREYTGVAEHCCGEVICISEIDRITDMHRNKKPFQARRLLKSIKYWQSVVNGLTTPKRKLAYYKNKLSYYHKSDIEYLKKTATEALKP